MLHEMPTSVNVPFQAMVDDGLLPAERLTLALLYAYADDGGIVLETPRSLEIPRTLHRNTIRAHLNKLAEIGYLLPIPQASRLDRVPHRESIEGYALFLKADGGRYEAAPPRARIGSTDWDAKQRWA